MGEPNEDAMAKVETSISELRSEVAGVRSQVNSLGPALAGLAGLDGIAAGLSAIAGIFEPLRRLGDRQVLDDMQVIDAIDRLGKATSAMPFLGAVPVPDYEIPFIGRRFDEQYPTYEQE